ncbi:MAG: hypothetical protein JOZ65_07585 [Chloroflexi bacterium]|nr:hypothetical protein [Chloroflexota bacterium]
MVHAQRIGPESRFRLARELFDGRGSEAFDIAALLRGTAGALQQNGRIRQERPSIGRLRERSPHRAADAPPELSLPDRMWGRSL